MTLHEDTAGNTSFSRTSPGLQLAIDSTSLGAFKTCPRWYYYTVIQGWESKFENVHFVFGLCMHEGRERYYHARARGEPHEEALRVALAYVLTKTWDTRLGRPWISTHETKNRLTLIRTLIWYLDRFGESDPLQTIVLSNGKPAVELSFRFDTQLETKGGEHWLLCGHIDRLGRLNDHVYIDDLKTTSRTISASFFTQFTPHNQFSLYSIAGRVIWHEPVAGLIADAVQVAVNFSRFERAMVPRSEPYLNEWFNGTSRWLQQMEVCATAGTAAEAAGLDPALGWPMNDMSCNNFSYGDGSRGGCPAREICSRNPASREASLRTEFKRRIWDPLQRRGDV